MSSLSMEQVLARRTAAGVELGPRSPGVRADWEPLIERLCASFGTPPSATHVPLSVYAQPLTRRSVAVVQAASEGGELRFHVLILPRGLYAALGDPFQIAENFPPPWTEKVALPTLAWLDGPLPARRVEQIRRVLQEEDSATLLGAAQTIIDGGRLRFERPFPAPDLLRRLWLLLPDSTRAEVWPASYMFQPGLDLNAVVVPPALASQFSHFLDENQAGDYPEGRYELNLQIAAETSDQDALDRLLARRSSRQTVILGLVLLVGMMLLALVMRGLD